MSKLTKTKCSYCYTLHGRDKVLFVLDLNGSLSVTNDAENVVEEIAKHYPDYRYLYRDSNNEWDELLHENKKFLDFGRLSKQDFEKYNADLS